MSELHAPLALASARSIIDSMTCMSLLGPSSPAHAEGGCRGKGGADPKARVGRGGEKATIACRSLLGRLLTPCLLT
eukprot:3084030-Karenia_brevis.AAC.1